MNQAEASYAPRHHQIQGTVVSETIIPTPNTREWAKYYAEAFGWKVVPLYYATGFEQCSCGKLSCKASSGKHPSVGTDWQSKATSDPQQIEMWWSAQPNANVGVRLGPTSGIVDIEYDDQVGLDTARRLGLNQIATPTYTSHRSTHRLFQSPTEVLSTKAVEKRAGLEIRLGVSTKGSQSVFPPSIHNSGVMYAWSQRLSPADVPIAPLPHCIIDLLRNNEQTTIFEVEGSLTKHPGEGEGNRHPTFIKLIGRWLQENGLNNLQPLYDEAVGWNARCRPPKDESYVFQTVNDIVQREASQQSFVSFGSDSWSNPEALDLNQAKVCLLNS